MVLPGKYSKRQKDIKVDTMPLKNIATALRTLVIIGFIRPSELLFRVSVVLHRCLHLWVDLRIHWSCGQSLLKLLYRGCCGIPC